MRRPRESAFLRLQTPLKEIEMTDETAMVRTITLVFTAIMMLMITGLVRGMIFVADAPRRRRMARKATSQGRQS